MEFKTCPEKSLNLLLAWKMAFCLEKSLQISESHWKIPILKKLDIFCIIPACVFDNHKDTSKKNHAFQVFYTHKMLKLVKVKFVWCSPKEAG